HHFTSCPFHCLHRPLTPPLCSSLTSRPPPRPTLFPYTTLFRSPRRWRRTQARPMRLFLRGRARLLRLRRHRRCGRAGIVSQPNRSEEHTSELQSLTNLVCRLLLEKKKDVSSRQRLDTQ